MNHGQLLINVHIDTNLVVTVSGVNTCFYSSGFNPEAENFDFKLIFFEFFQI